MNRNRPVLFSYQLICMAAKKDKTIYLIPGVGADETIFSNLELPAWEVRHLRWVKPHKDESLDGFVGRLLPQIRTDTQPVFIGMSFGGIVAIELSKLLQPFKTIIVSSIKTYYERPIKMSMFSYLHFHRYVPGRLAVMFDFLWHEWALGYLDKAERGLVAELVKNVDIPFNEWAVHQAITWQNTERLDNLTHIHGDRDNIFPSTYIRNYIRIKGGTHFMIYRRAKEISAIIHRELAE